MILVKSLYPETKCTPGRAIDMLDIHGHERLGLNSACDWGVSDPLAVPKTLEMKKREHLASRDRQRGFREPQEVPKPVAQFQGVTQNPMNLTKNKWYLVIGFLMLLAGIFLVVAAFASEGRPAGPIPWLKLGPVGLMSLVGGIGLLFLPAKIKLK